MRDSETLRDYSKISDGRTAPWRGGTTGAHDASLHVIAMVRWTKDASTEDNNALFPFPPAKIARDGRV